MVPKLTTEAISSTPRIVAQMGCEPFLDAILAEPDFDIVIGGRAYNPSPYVAYAAFWAISALKTDLDGLDKVVMGSLFHMGKIMECGGQCARPKSSAARATVYLNGTFDVTPLEPGARCTPLTVAAHTLHEKSRPDLLYGPGGCLDLNGAIYEQLSDNTTTRVSGGIFHKSSPGKYTIKLEAAHIVGYRTIFLGVFKDPVLLAQLDVLMERVTGYVKQQHADAHEQWKLGFHRMQTESSGGTFIVGEALAATQVLANSIASTARVACVHAPYPGQKATSGNFAMGIGGPTEIETGPCAEFCIYHLMELEHGEERASRERSEKASRDATDLPVAGQNLFRWKAISLGHCEEQHCDTGAAILNVSALGKTGPTSNSSNGISEAERKAHEKAKVSIKRHDRVPKSYETLVDIAQVIRSKNAGPFEITIDIIFDDKPSYDLIKNSELLSTKAVSEVLSLESRDIIYCGFFDQARAFKITFPRYRYGRLVPSGGFMESDVHGSQQYLPLLSIPFPLELKAQLIKDHYQ